MTLAEVGHAVVKATVKNTGTTALNLLKYGTLFDAAPVEKLSVMDAESKVAFEGVLRRVQTKDLAADVFYLLEAGATYETEINAAAVHTLTTGKYSVTAEGAIPYAQADSTELTGDAVYYKSNTLELPVDGALAAKVKRAIPTLSERTVLQAGCSTAQRTATTNALAKYVYSFLLAHVRPYLVLCFGWRLAFECRICISNNGSNDCFQCSTSTWTMRL